MTIHTRKLPTFALYAAYTDEFGLTVFGSCRDEALNNLVEELATKRGQLSAPAGQVPVCIGIADLRVEFGIVLQQAIEAEGCFPKEGLVAEYALRYINKPPWDL